MAGAKKTQHWVADDTVTVKNRQLYKGDPLPPGVTEEELAFLRQRGHVKEVGGDVGE